MTAPSYLPLAFRRQAAKSPLHVNEHLLRVAKSNKAVAVIWMRPRDFLALTTLASDNDWAREINGRPVQPIDAYNSYIDVGETIIMPALRVAYRDNGEPNHTAGRVLSHEGRHRAAAVMNARGSARLAVAINLAVDWASTYHPPGRYDRYLGLDDVPRLFLPQQWGAGSGTARTQPVEIGVEERDGALELWHN